MKNRKGFTLIELLAVIGLISVLIAVAYPKVMEQVEKKKVEITEAKKKLIYSAAEQYIDKNKNDYPIRKGKTYCIPLQILKNENLVAVNVDDLENMGVKLIVTDTKTYSLMDLGKCLGVNGPTMLAAKSGETHKGTVYLDPTDLTKTCTQSMAKSNFNSYGSTTEIKSGCMKWYIYDDSGSNYKMILDHNTTARIKWNDSGSNVALSSSNLNAELSALTTGSKWKVTPTIISAIDINTITGKTGWTSTSPWYYLDTNTQTVGNFNENVRSKYAWLFDNTYKCKSDNPDYGCNIEDNNKYAGTGTADDGYTLGYWTQTTYDNPGTGQHVWYIIKRGNMDYTSSDYTNFGIRPVITVEKTKITKVS